MGIGNIGKTLGLMGATVAAGGGPEDPVTDAAALFEGGDALFGGLTEAGSEAAAKEATPIGDSVASKYGYGLAKDAAAAKSGSSLLSKLRGANGILDALPKIPNAWSTTEGAAATTRGGLSGTQFRGM